MKALNAVFALCAGLTCTQPALAADLQGLWRTENGRSHITIAPCQDRYCGTITYLSQPLDETGRSKTDRNNPDPGERKRPLLGLKIVFDMKSTDSLNTWQGEIYNPEDGDMYRATMRLRPDGLKVEGCVAYIFCGSQIWTRIK